MDKLLPIFNFLKTNRFWLTCGLIAATMIGIWFMATSQLSQATARGKSEIESKISSANGVISTTSAGLEEESVVAHPNNSTIEGMEAEIEEATKAVIDAWQLRYDSQKELLKWPEDVVAFDQFKTAMLQYDPPEIFPADYMAGQGMRDILRAYRDHIPKRMESICQIIGTEWKFAEKEETNELQGRGSNRPGAGGRGGRGSRPGPGGMGPPGGAGPPGSGASQGERPGDFPGAGGRGSIGADMSGDDISVVVKWDEANQELWHQKLTNFKGFDGNPWRNFNIPTPLQVYMLQQDLWLMEAMFNIIGEVNGGANANDLAKVKRIDHIVFGREARAQLGEIVEPDVVTQAMTGSAEASGNNSRGSLRGRDPSGGRGAGGRGGRASRGAAKDGEDPFANILDPQSRPFHGRYVNEILEPITAEDVTKVTDLFGDEKAGPETPLPEKNLELLVARRVPVRIAVRMDERAIPEFLAASARSPFAFEVNQVRINKHIPGDGIVRAGAAGSQGTGSYGPGGPGGREESRDSIGTGGMGGGGGALDGGAPPAAGSGGGSEEEDGPVETRTHFNVDVEFYGIVKIYNPVNRKLLTGEDIAAVERTPLPAEDPQPEGEPAQAPEAIEEPAAADSNP